MQHRRERVADSAKNDLSRVCPGVPVELVRGGEELVSLGHGHAGDGQPAAAV